MSYWQIVKCTYFWELTTKETVIGCYLIWVQIKSVLKVSSSGWLIWYFDRGTVTSIKCGGKGKSCLYNLLKQTTPFTLYANVGQWHVSMFHNISASSLLFSRVFNACQNDPLSYCCIRLWWPPKERLWLPPTRKKMV